MLVIIKPARPHSPHASRSATKSILKLFVLFRQKAMTLASLMFSDSDAPTLSVRDGNETQQACFHRRIRSCVLVVSRAVPLIEAHSEYEDII
jgi:hypothetical protein